MIEKWTAVADICRCLHNFNGVLQVTSALQNTSVFRLKNTWLKVSKSVRSGGAIFSEKPWVSDVLNSVNTKCHAVTQTYIIHRSKQGGS